ncbi:MAG: ABC transporter ATP-binding protein [Dehalococcoidia bacterium]|nr:ABC transporter ATP-binding protein [Dehalococcoidia bacterium]
MTAAVSARGVRKSYGDFEALRGVDLEIEPGEVFALLGPNGAGKTTFVEILEGFRARSGGEATVLGVDPERGDLVWRSRLGIVLQSAGFFEQLTPDEVVSHFATFYPNPLDPRRVVDMVGLADKRSSRCKDLSGGQKRRVDLAMGIVGDPELVFLDEPTTGLDPQGRRQLWDVVREFARLGKTIVLTTHYLDEAEQLADRVGVIINGQLVEVGTPREIGGRERALARVTFALTGNLAGRPLPETAAETVTENGRVTITTATPTAVVTALARWAEANGEPELPALAVSRPSLEDIYLAMVEAADGQADHKGSDA